LFSSLDAPFLTSRRTRDFVGVRLDEVCLGNWTVIHTSNGEIEFVQIAFRKRILSSRLLMRRSASVKWGCWQTYEAVKNSVQARVSATLWEVPEHEVVCSLKIRSVLAFYAFYERFISNARISRVPSIRLPVMFGENASAVKSKHCIPIRLKQKRNSDRIHIISSICEAEC
jgi:hypothetical protein